ncbi:hypothetical protein Mal64_11430 [Pseudobythopirellula maris]|uniref:HTTM domain-containing protein n=1 Tax=Pseudobythopirellula maris TaxID=2527991 RepID=A0A5C5ZU66_9BACT|nr:DCC1-like thiol-disulfide oxidoreductase family protein [Pseudobythopirellula maris]TWT90746.1 hypothetical protein Mal64_11430 [Pseudobythopirellula maris]
MAPPFEGETAGGAGHANTSARRPIRRWQWIVVGLVGMAWLVSAVVALIVLPKLLLDAYDGESYSWLNDRVAAHARAAEGTGLPTRDREWYVGAGERYGYRALLHATSGLLVVLLVTFSQTVWRRVKGFLFYPDYSFNLGVLRAAVFAMMLYSLTHHPIAAVAAVPNELYEWPFLSKLFLSAVPIGPGFVAWALPLAKISSFVAAIGLFTRVSAPVAVVLSFCLLGISNLTGKVNHDHHVLLLAMIMACSRCADGFSLDALRRRLGASEVARPANEPQVTYGLPIRMTMVLIATCYFFPGYWKAAVGPGWVTDGAMRNVALGIWFQREYFEPLVRIDLYDLLGIGGALSAILFELGFLPALLFRWPRYLFAVVGFTFHNLTNAILGIAFWPLQAMYVAFVNWWWLLGWLGEKIGPSRLTIYFDGNCRLCRHTINLLLELDWLRCLEVRNTLQLEKSDPIYATADEQALLTDMHGAHYEEGALQTAVGYDVYRWIAWRIPLLWPLAPLMYLPPVSIVGRKIYRRVADSRACRVPSPVSPAEAPAKNGPLLWREVPLCVLFVLIMMGMFSTGFTRKVFSWPVACYPTFDAIGSPYIEWPTFWAVSPNGERRELDDDPIRDAYGSARFVEVLRRFVDRNEPDDRLRQALSVFVGLWKESGDLDTDSPPEAIEVVLARYHLTGPRRPKEPESTENRFLIKWNAITP